MLELFGMMRPFNCLMAITGVFIGFLVSAGLQGFHTIQFLFALVAVVMITGAGNVFNDYMDLEADKVNRPERPIPSGKVSRNSALTFAIIFFVLGNVFASMINGLCLTLAVINTILLVLYSVSFQHKILMGNVVIAYLVGSVFLFGGAIFFSANAIWLVLILTALAMLANISREIVKDLEDIEGDKKSFLKKLASKTTTSIAERFGVTTDGVKLKYKERTMIILAISCLILAVLFSVLPCYYGIMKLSYLVFIIPADVVFMSCIYSLSREQRRKKGYARISKRLKIAMLISLIAFIAGVLI